MSIELKETGSGLPVCRIGSIDIDPPLVLAPMAGVTNHAFRIMCRRAGGVGLVCTEMFSGYAIRFKDPKTRSMIDWTDEERPVSAQVFAGDPKTMAIAIKAIQELGPVDESDWVDADAKNRRKTVLDFATSFAMSKPDIMDLNFGCPVPKVAKSGAGASLLKDIGLSREIIEAARDEASIPLTVKTRIGWNWSDRQVFELAEIAQQCGVDAIAVHGRVAVQGYSGTADWDIIAEVKKRVGIPVIANGDIKTLDDAARAFEHTGCDAIMVGRGALGDPWLFKRMAHYLATGERLPEPDGVMRLDAAKAHAMLLRRLYGETRAGKEMRGHLVWYLKGMPGAPKLRARLMETRSVEEIGEVLDEARREC